MGARRQTIARITAVIACTAAVSLAPAAQASALAASSLGSVVSTTVEPAPEPTTEPGDPVDPPVPEPSDPGPQDPDPQPTEAPAPVEPVPEPSTAPVEPPPPIEEAPVDEVPFEEPSEEPFEEVPDEELAPVVPVPTATPTPTPTSTPIPAVNIFAPFYPAASGAARDTMPLMLAGGAAALIFCAAIVSFVVSRWRLARMRRMIHISNASVVMSPLPSARIGAHKMPSNLDISQLLSSASPAAASTAIISSQALSDVIGLAPARAIKDKPALRLELPAEVTAGRQIGRLPRLARPAMTSLVGVLGPTKAQAPTAAKAQSSAELISVFGSARKGVSAAVETAKTMVLSIPAAARTTGPGAQQFEFPAVFKR